jgi:hypothetical protein
MLLRALTRSNTNIINASRKVVKSNLDTMLKEITNTKLVKEYEMSKAMLIMNRYL